MVFHIFPLYLAMPNDALLPDKFSVVLQIYLRALRYTVKNEIYG